MNKRKIAIFVEGQAEYIFVRDFLCTWYDFNTNKLGLECYEYRSNKTNDVPYPFGSRESESFYQIYNVGNDNSVLSKILKNAENLKRAGYQLVVGLSDMYGDIYHKTVQNRKIDEHVNQLFKEARNKAIEYKGYQDFVTFHFAIMEVEAWFIGMYRYLQHIDKSLTPKRIASDLALDITKDPETTYYHPAKVLGQIYNIAGKTYKKHESDVCAITAALTKHDYQNLIHSGKCQSFANFANSILL